MSVFDIVSNLFKDVRVCHCATCDHNAVNVTKREFFCVSFRAEHVSVTDDWDVDTFFYVFNDLPVSKS